MKNINKYFHFITFTLLGLSAAGMAQDKTAVWEKIADLKDEHDTSKVITMNTIAGMYYMLGVKDSSAWYLDEALRLCSNCDFQRGFCTTYSNLGTMEMMNRHFAKSVRYFKKALEIAETHNFRRNILFHNIALALSTENKYDEAIIYFKKAIEAGKKELDTLSTVYNYSSAGNCYLSARDTVKAYEYCLEAQRICKAFVKNRQLSDFEKLSVEDVTRTTDITIAQIMVARRQFKEAVQKADILWAQRGAHKDTVQLARILKTLARGYEELANLEKAAYYTRVADTLIGGNLPQYKDMCRNIYEVQARVYARMGRFEDAYKSQLKFKVANDSCTNAENSKNITEILTRYETEKKTEEIARLQKEKRTQRLLIGAAVALALVTLGLLLLVTRSKRLQKKLFVQQQELNRRQYEKELGALEQKALRAQMNPHFIFNALTSINKFVNNNDQPGADRFISIFAGLIRQTLDNSGKPFITLEEEVSYLRHYLELEQMRQPGRFHYEIRVAEGIDATETYFPGMLVQPFVENSIVHAFPPGYDKAGLIAIHFTKNGRLNCVVEDNGVGRQAITKLTFAHDSKGLTITENRIKAMNRVYESDIQLAVEDLSGEASGTRVRISVPLHLSS